VICVGSIERPPAIPGINVTRIDLGCDIVIVAPFRNERKSCPRKGIRDEEPRACIVWRSTGEAPLSDGIMSLRDNNNVMEPR
jgi:hypothetical protein